MLSYFHHLSVPPSALVWWKDLCRIGDWGSNDRDWVFDNSRLKVEDSISSLFWHDVWLGDDSLRSRFLRLYFLAADLNVVVSSCGS